MVLPLFDAVPLLAFTTIDGPNQKWDGDITYIWTREGWLYRAVILDMHSRRVIALSWSGRVNHCQVIVGQSATRLSVTWLSEHSRSRSHSALRQRASTTPIVLLGTYASRNSLSGNGTVNIAHTTIKKSCANMDSVGFSCSMETVRRLTVTYSHNIFFHELLLVVCLT